MCMNHIVPCIQVFVRNWNLKWRCTKIHRDAVATETYSKLFDSGYYWTMSQLYATISVKASQLGLLVGFCNANAYVGWYNDKPTLLSPTEKDCQRLDLSICTIWMTAMFYSSETTFRLYSSTLLCFRYNLYKMPCNCISCAKCGLGYIYRYYRCPVIGSESVRYLTHVAVYAWLDVKDYPCT